MTAATLPIAQRLLRPTLPELWLFLAVAIPALAALVAPMPAVDLAYQLRAGAAILGDGRIPTVDTWTFTAAGEPWLDQQWGAQVLLAAAYQASGWTGLAVLRAGLVALAFGLLLATLRRAGPRMSAREVVLIGIAAFVVASPALALRPQLLAIALLSLELWLLIQRRRHPRGLWLVPLIAMAWANVHGSFPLVLVSIGFAWLDDVLRSRPGGRLIVVLAVSAAATLVNPYGLDVWRYVANLASNPTIASQVSEWRPPSLFDPAGLLFFASLLAAGVALALRRGPIWRLGRRAVAPLLTLVAFAALALVTGRGLAWWALAAPLALVTVLCRSRGEDEATAPPAPAEGTARRSPLNAAIAALLALAAIALLPAWRPVGPAGVPAGTLTYAPEGISARLVELADTGMIPPQARVWNPQLWGSWLEFAAPQHLYALDSRIELFPGEVWSATGRFVAGECQLQADVVVVPTSDSALAERVERSDFVLLHRDDDGSIWRLPDDATAPTGAPC